MFPEGDVDKGMGESLGQELAGPRTVAIVVHAFGLAYIQNIALVATLAGAMVAIFALDKSTSGFVDIFGANRAARIVDSVHINNWWVIYQKIGLTPHPSILYHKQEPYIIQYHRGIHCQLLFHRCK